MNARARRTHFLPSLAISLIVHASIFAIALGLALRARPPFFSMQSGTGGDGIPNGQVLEPATVGELGIPEFTAAIAVPPVESTAVEAIRRRVIADEVISEPASTTLHADGNGAFPSLDASEHSIGITALGEVDAVAQYPRFTTANHALPREAANDASSGVPGAGGSGGDGFAVIGAPVASARNRPPRYPPEALRRGIQGTVVLCLQVLADGRVGDVSMRQSSGSEILDAAAIDAARGWYFTPPISGVTPVACEINLPVQFGLTGNRS